ncbi:MAG: diacylglycerol kinase family lipid kinase [Actinomycetales bacterium]|nr:diacylglycerol kinase family lipid kinase [Actinomycetales bacterium]
MTPTAASERRAAVIYNPVKVDLAKLRKAVEKAEERAGWASSIWLETSEEDPGAGRAREAVERGAAVVIAAGGDGTVRSVAEGLGGSGVPVALMPAGTGNLLARNLDLTLGHLDEAVRTAFEGRDRAIDLGRVEVEREDGSRDEHAFVVMAGVGLDAQMVANTNPELKKRVGWLAYVDAIARSLRDSNKIRVRYALDDGEQKALSAHTVLVGNCGSLPGNMLLLPEAAVDDGVFDIVTLRPEGFGGWVSIWVKIVWENGVLRRSSVGRKLMGMTREIRTMRYFKAAGFTARLDRPQEFELDGDAFGVAIAFRARVDEGALIVRVPQDHAGGRRG